MSISIDPSQILIKIWDATAGELKHLRRPKPRIEELEEAIAKLTAKVDDINNNIRLAQLEGEIPTSEVKLWLSEVEKLKGKAAAIEHDFQSRRCLGAWSWNCFSVNRRVAKGMEEIDKLMTRSDATPVAMKPPPSAVVQIPTSNSTLSIEPYMSKILCYIASPNATEVIGIYGMGGVGKTTLLRNINNHNDVARFDHVIWAVASKDCKIEKLQKDIAKWLKLHVEKDDNEVHLAIKLCDFLTNKDCLLLLDDLWEPLDLAMLGMVHASSGQGEQQKRKVVVFTTRDEQVCGGMKASKEMQIKCLEPKEAWELFKSKASGAIGSDVGIEHIARQIADECAGLPLALITVGMAMSKKKSWEAWKNTLTLMKHSQMPKVTGKADPMFTAFKLSYDNLEDDDIRGCLLSCALWPEDHLIHKDKLIECWMGLGLIDEVGAIHKAYNRGHSHIETLKAACLLEPDDKEWNIKMHDVIRDMALWMASDCGKKKLKWIVRAGVAAIQAFEEEGWHEAERVSLMYNDIASLPNQLSTCSKLSVLMLQYNRELMEIHGTLIQAMCSLTYLDLGNTAIIELPKEIGLLSELRHLNLSGTKIEELPTELGCLGKLMFLFLTYMHNLKTIAKGAISSLSSLKCLDLRGSGCQNELLNEVEGIKGCQKCSISIEIRTLAALKRLCSLPHVLIWQLNVYNIYDSANPNTLLDDIIKSRSTRQSMEELSIEMVKVNEFFISEGNKEAGGLKCLKRLFLTALSQLEEITWKGVLPQTIFPNLGELIIVSCYNLRNLNWVLQLPSLSVLEIAHCNVMEELISDKDCSGPLRFGLRMLRLFELDKLTKISWRPLYFSNLEEIEVRACPLLRKMPFDKVNRLQVIRCGKKWWDNLEWEDESIKNSLLPLVTLGKDLLPLASVEQIPTSHSTAGIEECMKIILGHIASPNATEVIGVYGMAGVGKTTLLHRIYNHMDVDKFDHVIWAVASRDCKMERLQQYIASKLLISHWEDDTERDRASKLFDFLEDKECLLLLDDLWTPLDLTKLGLARAMARQRKQKRKVVVFTTRNEHVCSDMNASTKMEMKCLEPEQAWKLFRRKASEDAIGADAGIESIARQITKKCSGFPLALITVGMAMSIENSLEAWNDALTMMKKEADPMFSAFKLSYDSLDDDDMRGCLLSCALWPEYQSINKDELIECWMGLGLLDKVGAIHEAYSKGHSHIETFKARCLLESGDDETVVKMYNVIRDMALSMASDCGKKKFKWIVRARVAEGQAFKEEGWHEAERVSLMSNDITSLPNQLSTCSKLSVLMLQHNWKLKEIHGILIQAMYSLTYLDLQYTRITELPREIGLLSQLQHLNLSCTPIEELPAELGYLGKLNFLYLRYMHNLKIVAKGAISALSSLKCLDLRGMAYEKDKWLNELEGLKGCYKCSIGINIETTAALQRLCLLQHVLIWQLNVVEFNDSVNPNQLLDDIIKSRNTRRSMERLSIVEVKMNELLISEGNEEAGGLECLKCLKLYSLPQLEEITWKGGLPQILFPNLRELYISSCHRLRNLNWVLQSPSLSVMEISGCNAMEELISDEGSSSCSSFGLKKMKLRYMDRLKRIASRTLKFPNLEEIEVCGCRLLKKQPFGNEISVNRLKVIRCEKIWWDKLEWEDVSIKDSLSPLLGR